MDEKTARKYRRLECDYRSYLPFFKRKSQNESCLQHNWNSIGFADASTGIAVGDLGAIVITNDGGSTWSEYQSGVKERFGKIILHGRNGLILGSQYVYTVKVGID